jgi:hypothetical protein
VNFGGEPGRDDGGLPPVDIEIPDDARELERDMLAYRRELRSLRRRARARRLARPFTRHGMFLPLIATCVALSMLTGALLSVFTASPAAEPTSSTARQPSLSPVRLPSPQAATDATLLPDRVVQVGATREPLRSLVKSVLALVPATCGTSCDRNLGQLVSQAKAARVAVYFVGTDAAQVTRLTARDGASTAMAVYDQNDVLGTAYRPAGLTVVLVHSDAAASVQRNLPAGFQLEAQFRQLRRPGLGTPAPATS